MSLGARMGSISRKILVLVVLAVLALVATVVVFIYSAQRDQDFLDRRLASAELERSSQEMTIEVSDSVLSGLKLLTADGVLDNPGQILSVFSWKQV